MLDIVTFAIVLIAAVVMGKRGIAAWHGKKSCGSGGACSQCRGCALQHSAAALAPYADKTAK